MRRFKLNWADATEVTMATCRIVEALDVLEHVQSGSFSVSVYSFLDAFLLQAAEEGLRDRVVPAVCAPTHAWLEVVGLAEAPPSVAPILRSLI